MNTSSWLIEAEQQVARDPASITLLFRDAGRRVGRRAMDPVSDRTGSIAGTTADVARARLILALAAPEPEQLGQRLASLYREGDSEERVGVLHGLGELQDAGLVSDEVAAAGLGLIRDALRANEPRLVAAAMGKFASCHLPQHEWRHGVIKLVFMQVPLAAVDGLDRRHDGELERMARDLVNERRSAGRPIPDDLRMLTRTGEHDIDHDEEKGD